MKKVVAVIPIKLNNVRLPGKNIKKLGTEPLISYIQKTLLKCEKIDCRYVYCSEQQIEKYLLDGVKYLRRSPSLDRDDTNFTQIFDAFCREVQADVYVYTHATAPFLSVETINECIEMVCNSEYDSAFTAVKIKDFLWKDNKALNFDPEHVPRSQDIDPIYRETSGVYVFKRDVFEKMRRRVGEKPYIKEVGYIESIDINLPEDFELAEMLLRAKYRRYDGGKV